MLLQTKLTNWAQRDTTSAKHHIHGLEENRLVIQILRHWTKIKDLKALLSHKTELYSSKERKCSCIRGQIMPTSRRENRENKYRNKQHFGMR